MFRAICVASLALLSTQAEAKIKEISYGIEEYSHETLDSLQTFGTVKLDTTKVRDTLEVNGQLSAHGCEIGKLRVKGHAILHSCLVKKRSNIQGLLEASKCQFLEPLTLASDHLILDSCTVKSIQVSDSGKEQVVELKGGTKIYGPIKFESGQGILIKDATSEFNGELIGGTLKS